MCRVRTGTLWKTDVSASEAGEVQNRAVMKLYCTQRLTGWVSKRVDRQVGS